MNLLLNIGLASEAFGVINWRHALQATRLQGIQVLAYRVLNSDTEPTIVARVNLPTVLILAETRPLYTLARLLGQDCIAAYNEYERVGHLAGPAGAKWGAFNPECFFLLDGTRLAQPVAQAA